MRYSVDATLAELVVKYSRAAIVSDDRVTPRRAARALLRAALPRAGILRRIALAEIRVW